MYEDWKGTRTTRIHKLHLEYGPVVRVGPNEVSFNHQAGLRTIYGAGSKFETTEFYRMFDFYGRQNLPTFSSSMGEIQGCCCEEFERVCATQYIRAAMETS